MRLSLKTSFRLVIALALCLVAPLAALADFNIEPPCPMMADASMPAGSGGAHLCKMHCAQDSMAAGACGSCQFCKIGGVFPHASSLPASGFPLAQNQPVSAVVSLIEHAPAPLWRPPRTI